MRKFIQHFENLQKRIQLMETLWIKANIRKPCQKCEKNSREAWRLFSIVLSCLSVYQSLKLYKQFSAAWKVGQEPLHANY